MDSKVKKVAAPTQQELDQIIDRATPVDRQSREIVTTQPDGSIAVSSATPAEDISPRIVLGVVVCDTMKQVMAMARHYCRAGMVPRGLEGKSTSETESRVAVAIEYGLNIGMTPLQSLSNVLIIQNRPCLWGDAPMSLVLQHKAYAGSKVEWIGTGDDLACRFTVYRKVGEEKIATEWVFGVKDAKAAGLWGKHGPWMNYPRRMMMYRARAFALRDAFPDALRGAGIAEEFEAAQDSTTSELESKIINGS